jgi:transcriptional regulator with XRE-family HTH domain
MTQASLAERAGVDPVTIARVEQGRGPGWWRKTARAVFKALADHTPIDQADADRYFQLSKYNPKDDEVARAIAEGTITVGPRPVNPHPVPEDLQDLLEKLVFSFGEAHVRALLRTLSSLSIRTDEPLHAVAIDDTPARKRKPG